MQFSVKIAKNAHETCVPKHRHFPEALSLEFPCSLSKMSSRAAILEFVTCQMLFSTGFDQQWEALSATSTMHLAGTQA